MDAVSVELLAPEQLQLRFAEAAKTASADIKSFALMIEDERSKDVMERAKKSRAECGENIRTWLVAEHEDWLDVKQDGASEDDDLAGNESDTKMFTTENSTGDIQKILERFKESHPGIEASLADVTKTIKVWVTEKAFGHQLILPDIFTAASPYTLRSPAQLRGWG